MAFHHFRADSESPHVSGPFSRFSKPIVMFLDVLKRKIDALDRGLHGHVRKCPEISVAPEMYGFGVRKCPQISRKKPFQKNTYENFLRGNFFMSDDSGMLR